jgi:hypothetical protein
MARLLSFFSIATASLRWRQESRFHIFIPNRRIPNRRTAARELARRVLGGESAVQSVHATHFA